MNEAFISLSVWTHVLKCWSFPSLTAKSSWTVIHRGEMTASVLEWWCSLPAAINVCSARPWCEPWFTSESLASLSLQSLWALWLAPQVCVVTLSSLSLLYPSTIPSSIPLLSLSSPEDFFLFPLPGYRLAWPSLTFLYTGPILSFSADCAAHSQGQTIACFHYSHPAWYIPSLYLLLFTQLTFSISSC